MKTLAILLMIFFAVPCFSQDGAENRVMLREYVDRVLLEKDKYFDSCFQSLHKSLEASQSSAEKALALSQVELDRRFVTIEKWITATNAYNSQITDIERRLTIIETEGRWQATIWAGGVALFFTIIQISMRFWERKRRT